MQGNYPGEAGRTECWGARSWRNNYIYAFVRAGFDVLTLDKRGHGISGGKVNANTNEQGNDLFRFLDAMETGAGLRLRKPDGTIVEADAAAGALLSGYRSARELPVFLSGASQGCLVSMAGMHKNIVGGKDNDRPEGVDLEPRGYNFKGAMLLAPFTAGLGYRAPIEALAEASRRVDLNVQMFSTSEIMSRMHLWPAIFIGRGLWDFSESVEGSLVAYHRASEPKAIVGVRGPHGESEWGQVNIEYMVSRMITFASAVLFDQPLEGFDKPTSIKDVVAAAPADWAPAYQLNNGY